MRTETVVVTPEKAKEWLEKNANTQRKLRDSIVNRYAVDMVSERWKLTHQGIAFDTKGRLIDGQHRLAAVVMAGIPVTMLVSKDVPSMAFDHVDIGFGRTYSDVFTARGEGWITKDHVAMARLMEYGADKKAINTNRSPFELRDLVENHKNAIEFVLQNVERRVRGITSSTTLAAIATAYYFERDRVKLAEFIRVLVSGVAQDPVRDEVAIKLREYLKDVAGAGGTGARTETFLKVQRVVKAYMLGERLSKIYTPNKPVYECGHKTTITVE